MFGKADLAEVPASSADYCAILAGRAPVHARPDASFKRAQHGSTARHVGDGYSLPDVRDVRFIGGVPGVFGPVLKFDGRLSKGGLEVSQLRLVGTPVRY